MRFVIPLIVQALFMCCTLEAQLLEKYFVDMLVRIDEIEMNQNDHLDFMEKFAGQAARYLLPVQRKFVQRLEEEILPISTTTSTITEQQYRELCFVYSGIKADRRKVEKLASDLIQKLHEDIHTLFDSLKIAQGSISSRIEALENEYPFSEKVESFPFYFMGRRDSAWKRVPQ